MAHRARILIVDDEANARAALGEILHDEGYATELAADGFKALGKLEEFSPNVVLTDLKMPGLDGIGLMSKARAVVPHATFVVMTAFGTIESAVEAVRKGAHDYLTKPLDYRALLLVVERAVERARLVEDNARLRDKLRESNTARHIVAADPAMKEALRLVAQVAPSKATVLITGETGTGKELIAEAIHRGSPRADKPFVRTNCAALSESLLESELFGHERGAFTGAVGRREGRFERADGGTFFLDEVSEIPLALQVKLLRVIQERTFERVGSSEPVSVDARIIAATNRDLRERVASGLFREDLFYRLNVVTVDIPPLRKRPADIPELATFFLKGFMVDNRKTIEGFTDAALATLVAHTWPGNVRELQNAVERAVVLCDGPMIEAHHLPPALAGESKSDLAPPIPGSSIAELERYAILKTLEACKGSTSRAAQLLGISPRKVQYKLHEYARERDGEPPVSKLPASATGPWEEEES